MSWRLQQMSRTIISVCLMKLHRMTWQVSCCCLLRIQTLRPLSWAKKKQIRIFGTAAPGATLHSLKTGGKPAGGHIPAQSNVSLALKWEEVGNWKWPHLLGNKLKTRYAGPFFYKLEKKSTGTAEKWRCYYHNWGSMQSCCYKRCPTDTLSFLGMNANETLPKWERKEGLNTVLEIFILTSLVVGL